MTLRSGPYTFEALSRGPEDGELVVLLHGFPQRKDAWRQVAAGLGEAGYRAVAPDLRGYAEGARPSEVGAYRLSTVAEDVLAWADQLGARRFHVVGHDWGGALAWAVAALHPERVATVTSLSVAHPRAVVAALPGVQALRSSYVGLFVLPVVPEVVLRASLRPLLLASGLGAEMTSRYVDGVVRSGALRTALNWYRANAASGEVRRIGPVSPPALLVWGSADPSMGRRAVRRTGDQVLGPYQLVVVEGAGHWLPERHPEEVLGALIPHLARGRVEVAP